MKTSSSKLNKITSLISFLLMAIIAKNYKILQKEI